MGSWGHSGGGFKTKEECRRFVDQFTEAENASPKDVAYYDREFKSIEEAKEYAESHVDKWGDAVAVSYLGLPPELRQTANVRRLEQLKEDLKAKKKGIEDLLGNMGDARASHEVEFVKCDECLSKINSRHLIRLDLYNILDHQDSKMLFYGCPACNARALRPKFLKVEFKKLEKEVKALNDIKAKISEVKKKIEDENPRSVYWFVSVFIPT